MHPDIDPRLSLSTCHIFLGTTWDKILNLSLQRIPGVSFSSTPSCTFLQSCALQSGLMARRAPQCASHPIVYLQIVYLQRQF